MLVDYMNCRGLVEIDLLRLDAVLCGRRKRRGMDPHERGSQALCQLGAIPVV